MLQVYSEARELEARALFFSCFFLCYSSAANRVDVRRTRNVHHIATYADSFGASVCFSGDIFACVRVVVGWLVLQVERAVSDIIPRARIIRIIAAVVLLRSHRYQIIVMSPLS